jgi:transglutaminase/protease-like cytokinesis protein 3
MDLKKFRQIKHTEDADDCYFFTNPRDLLWTHLPDDPAWQLVDEPMSFWKWNDYFWWHWTINDI